MKFAMAGSTVAVHTHTHTHTHTCSLKKIGGVRNDTSK